MFYIPHWISVSPFGVVFLLPKKSLYYFFSHRSLAIHFLNFCFSEKLFILLLLLMDAPPPTHPPVCSSGQIFTLNTVKMSCCYFLTFIISVENSLVSLIVAPFSNVSPPCSPAPGWRNLGCFQISSSFLASSSLTMTCLGFVFLLFFLRVCRDCMNLWLENFHRPFPFEYCRCLLLFLLSFSCTTITELQ